MSQPTNWQRTQLAPVEQNHVLGNVAGLSSLRQCLAPTVNDMAKTWNWHWYKQHDHTLLWSQETVLRMKKATASSEWLRMDSFKFGGTDGLCSCPSQEAHSKTRVTVRRHQGSLTKSIILSPSSSLQFLFFSLWASSMTTQRQGILRSSGQSVRIISNVVMMAWNLYDPFITRPYRCRANLLHRSDYVSKSEDKRSR